MAWTKRQSAGGTKGSLTVNLRHITMRRTFQPHKIQHETLSLSLIWEHHRKDLEEPEIERERERERERQRETERERERDGYKQHRHITQKGTIQQSNGKIQATQHPADGGSKAPSRRKVCRCACFLAIRSMGGWVGFDVQVLPLGGFHRQESSKLCKLRNPKSMPPCKDFMKTTCGQICYSTAGRGLPVCLSK